MNPHPPVSVIMPVRNEERHLASAVAEVLAQEYPGQLEVVLAVGPSTDRTRGIAEELAAGDARITVVANPTGFTPAGLNVALRAARHDIIVRVDGHAELSDGYITTAVRLLRETGAANVGGRMEAHGRTPFEQAVAAAYNSPLGLGGGGFHLAETPAGPAETVFLGVFRREALEQVGGFDEALHRAQDWELNHRLRTAGLLVYYSPELRVVYRPRSGLRALATQFFRTGQWRREVIRRHPETASVRYLAPPVVAASSLLGLVSGTLGILLRAPLLITGLIAPGAYLAFLGYATTTMPTVSRAARLRLPVVLATMHFAWGLGFLRGLRGGAAAPRVPG
ncbi:glycosyltransferase family 2 protein [Arachnia propionica]|uniref:Glycosyltransferase family 2 protein n=1 Tax=Arachnia propionica TaxID=1750 RepID=A0A3P1T6K1_9ACTN|nr:glycosyltransferase family 2 protein [Arachnia propionica]RRD04033.1 glycosyltransferase family 2 protein [Arachnia propionica]